MLRSLLPPHTPPLYAPLHRRQHPTSFPPSSLSWPCRFGNGGTTAYQECWIPLRLAYHQEVRLELTPRDTWFDVLCKGGYLSGVKLSSCAGTGDVAEHENTTSDLGKALHHLSGTRPFTWLKKRGLLGMNPLLISVAFCFEFEK